MRELLLFRVDPRRQPRTDHVAADGPVERAVAALLHGDRAALVALYAPEALLDVDVPHGVTGRSVRGARGSWRLLRLPPETTGGRCAALRRTDTGSGVLVETEVHLGARCWRDHHRLVFAGGRIVEHVVHCTELPEDAVAPQPRRGAGLRR